MKTYDIYCITKANGHQYLHCCHVYANNAGEAKKMMKEHIEWQLDRHAFSLGTKPGGGWNWAYIANERGITIDDIFEQAFKREGFMIV